MKARRRRGRIIDGLLLLDKARGVTSNFALQQVKSLFNAAKAGHTGSLDPLATGMLPICFGEATKFCQYLLEADKHYTVVAQLGMRTTTGDSEGEVIQQQAVPVFKSKQLEQTLTRFRGVITQIPSMFSAIKYQGKPLYELARQGIEVPRQPREVHIYELSLVTYDKTLQQLTLDVHCSKGTYVRNLVEDIGIDLTCDAHVIALRRNRVAAFKEQQMISFDELRPIKETQGCEALDRSLISLETAFSQWPKVCLTETLAFYLRRGESVWVPKAPSEGLVSLILAEQDFLGLGEVQEDGRIKPKRLVQTPKPCSNA